MKFSRGQISQTIVGTVSILLHIVGLYTGNYLFNFGACLLSQVSSILYASNISAFSPIFLLPAIFGVINLVTGDAAYLYCELVTQSIIFQYLAIIVYVKMTPKDQ